MDETLQVSTEVIEMIDKFSEKMGSQVWNEAFMVMTDKGQNGKRYKELSSSEKRKVDWVYTLLNGNKGKNVSYYLVLLIEKCKKYNTTSSLLYHEFEEINRSFTSMLSLVQEYIHNELSYNERDQLKTYETAFVQRVRNNLHKIQEIEEKNQARLRPLVPRQKKGILGFGKRLEEKYIIGGLIFVAALGLSAAIANHDGPTDLEVMQMLEQEYNRR